MCLVEARGLGLMRSAREGDELRTGTNRRALLSAIASGREEIERIGRKHGWSVGVREEMLDRLQAMVREPMQKGRRYHHEQHPAQVARAGHAAS